MQTIQNLKYTTQLSKFDYTYNPVGTIATWAQQADSSTAVVNTLTYDAADQLTSDVQSGGGSDSNAYHYDPAGNRLSETTGSGTTAGQFNNVNQLTRLSSNVTSQTVAGHTSAAITNAVVNAIPATISNSTNFTATVPLPAGTNVVSVVAQPSTGDTTTKRYQVTTTGTAPTTLSYDANGNTTTDENGNDYKWDALNRLTAIIYHSGTHTEFAYDGLSRRIQIVERAGTTVGSGTVSSTKDYLWIGSEIAEERNSSNAVQKRFFPQGEQQLGTYYYYTLDHLGSLREMCDSSGTIVARYNYDPYGTVTLLSGSNLATFQYAGNYVHQASGLILTTYRAYTPKTGRWLIRDPIKESGGVNLYDYVSNDPNLFTDTDGLAASFDITPGPDKGHMSQSVNISVSGCSCPTGGYVAFKQLVATYRTLNIPAWDRPDESIWASGLHNYWYPSDSSGPTGGVMSDWPGQHVVTYDKHGGITGSQDISTPILSRTGFTMRFETCAYCTNLKDEEIGKGKLIGCRSWAVHWSANGDLTVNGFGRNLPALPFEPF